MITLNTNQLNEVDEPTLEEKLDAKTKLHVRLSAALRVGVDWKIDFLPSIHTSVW